MSDPYNYPFIKKDNTMYLSTISKNDFQVPKPFYRQSTFQQHDITGTSPKVLIPKNSTGTNFSLSTYIQPIPNTSKTINKTSNPLFIDDIQGARPKATEFRSKRVVDPLCPKYILPSASQIVLDNGRKFMRDTLNINDINGKRSHTWQNRGKQILKQPVEGSQPSKLTKEGVGISRLQVKDINKDLLFQTTRTTNPLNPSYMWRDNDDKKVNKQYGVIQGSDVKKIHPAVVNKQNNMCLGINDIQGTQANSFNAKAHFIDKRRQFRNYMTTHDIDKSNSSSLKKGIITNRQTNPLMPNYQFPGNKQIAK